MITLKVSKRRLQLVLLLLFAVALISVVYFSLFYHTSTSGSTVSHSGRALDKHLVAYSTLSLLLSLIFVLRGSAKYVLFLSALALLLVSAAIELIQPYCARSASWYDFSANLFGVVLGVLVAQLLFKPLKRFVA